MVIKRKISYKKVVIFSILGRIRIRFSTKRIRSRMKMKQTRNTGRWKNIMKTEGTAGKNEREEGEKCIKNGLKCLKKAYSWLWAASEFAVNGI